MKHQYFLFFFSLLFSATSMAQQPGDSAVQKPVIDTVARDSVISDSIVLIPDSIRLLIPFVKDSSLQAASDTFVPIFGAQPFWGEYRKYIYSKNRQFNFNADLHGNNPTRKTFLGKEYLFYYF